MFSFIMGLVSKTDSSFFPGTKIDPMISEICSRVLRGSSNQTILRTFKIYPLSNNILQSLPVFSFTKSLGLFRTRGKKWLFLAIQTFLQTIISVFCIQMNLGLQSGSIPEVYFHKFGLLWFRRAFPIISYGPMCLQCLFSCNLQPSGYLHNFISTTFRLFLAGLSTISMFSITYFHCPSLYTLFKII